ncbi:MAG: hypothetical protein HY901_19940 [Deltaproteobacteria bacterium]|nr:hypothetical protein [Deltaproteobacteria bacterium]
MSAPLAVLLLASLHAAPAEAGTGTPAGTSGDVAVLIIRRAGLPRPPANDLAVRVANGLRAAGVRVPRSTAELLVDLKKAAVADPESCVGDKRCAQALGAKLRVGAVVGIEVGALGLSVAIHLEALSVATGESLVQFDQLLPRDQLTSLPGFDVFANSLQEALRPPPPPPVVLAGEAPRGVDAPRMVDSRSPPEQDQPTGPSPEMPPEAVAAPLGGQGGRTAGYVMAGTAAAAAVAAVACAVSGLILKPALDGEPIGDTGRRRVDMTLAEAESRRDTANALFTASLITGLVAVAAGGTAVFVW